MSGEAEVPGRPLAAADLGSVFMCFLRALFDAETCNRTLKTQHLILPKLLGLQRLCAWLC